MAAHAIDSIMKWIIQTINLLLILVAAWAGVTLFYHFAESKLSPADPALPPVNPAAAARLETRRLMSDYQKIIERDLFHTLNHTAQKNPSPIDVDALKATVLSLKLWGTISTDKKESGRARAVIEDTQSGEQHLFKVGDTVQNAIIVEIFRNSVVLSVDGRKEKLVIVVEHLAATEGPVAAEEKSPTTLSRAQIDDALNNVNELMTQAKVKPLFQDGKAGGVIVSTIEPQSFFSKMGFKTGDIITGVNGRKLESVDDAMAFYKTLAAGSKLSVELIRRGRPTTIDFVIE